MLLLTTECFFVRHPPFATTMRWLLVNMRAFCVVLYRQSPSRVAESMMMMMMMTTMTMMTMTMMMMTRPLPQHAQLRRRSDARFRRTVTKTEALFGSLDPQTITISSCGCGVVVVALT